MADNVVHDQPIRNNPGVGREVEKQEPQQPKEPRQIVKLYPDQIRELLIPIRKAR